MSGEILADTNAGFMVDLSSFNSCGDIRSESSYQSYLWLERSNIMAAGKI